MAKGVPTSIRLPDEIEQYINAIAETLKLSNLQIEHTRNGVICMILQYNMKKGSNELFKMVLQNVKNRNEVDAYTVRGVVKKITQYEMTDVHFETAIGEVDAAIDI